MPTTYAHSSFGDQVRKRFDESIKNIIETEKNIELFNIGLHGPDILFYYKPLSSNKINKTGHHLHEEDVHKFLTRARNTINKSSNKNASFSYIAGFICHFMLDSCCHPYIREIEMKGISHSTIEAEMDRFLMIKNNLDPMSFKPTKHIVLKEENAKCIAEFYEVISAEEILSALKSMKMHLNLLAAPKKIKRNIITAALKISHNEGMIDLMMSDEPDERCKECSNHLLDLYQEAILPSAEIVKEFYLNLGVNKELNNRFNRNFG